MSAKTYKNLIDGAWVESRSGQTYENLNPADTRDIVGIFQRSDQRDIADAVSAAARAFDRWRLVPAPRRAEIIYRAGELLLERKEEYARQMTQEMGKVLNEARGDVQESVDTAYYMAGEGRRQFGATVPSELPSKFAMAVRMPIGVCGMISPWNFPMAIPSWKLFPALVCGNTCVIKPAEDTPLSTINLVKALIDAGLPKGVVNVVTGYGPEAGAPLVEQTNVRAVSFTGSSEVGRIVGEVAARSFKPCSLEMGGKNAIIILDDANLDLAVEGVLWGAFGTTGHETVDMGPQVNHAQVETAQKYVDIGKNEGAKLELGGHRLTGPAYDNGWFFEPTIFTDVDPKMRIAQEEIFGPVTALIPCNDFDHAIEIANGVAYGLSSSVYTRDVNKAFKAMRDIYAGITYINAPTIGAEVHLPFGGTKATGNGHREGGLGAIDFYSQWKSIYVDFSDRLQRAQIDTGE